MKYITITLIIVFLFTACDQLHRPKLPNSQELQDALDSARQSADLVGVSAAIIVPDGETWLGTSGESHNGHPISTDMLFDIGSAGKIILGPLMVKLAEQRLISLDDPIHTYLPDFPYADGTITVRQLLNHTNGIFMMVKHPDSPFHKPYGEIDHKHWWTIDEIFGELGGEPYFPPGQGWCYTQAGYQIASLIVESVTGQTVAQAAQMHLLEPAGIKGMVMDFSELIPEEINIAHPWVDTNLDGLYEDAHQYSRNWIASLSRILVYASAEDLAEWGHALLTGQVLSQESMDEMLDFYHTDDWCGEPFITGYGLGVHEYDPTLTLGQTAWGHLGSIQGYRTFLAHFPHQGITLAIMTNTDSDGAMIVVEKLLEVLFMNFDATTNGLQPINVEPEMRPPDDANVFDTFQKEKLFCDHQSQWALTAGTEDWINISLDWVVGTDETRAENAWRYHNHTIMVNGVEIPDLESFTHDVIRYTVACPDETLEFWAKGLSVYLPPLTAGEYEIKWFSQITGEFDNGWVTYQPGNFMELTTNLKVK